tara:strand:+ start:5269 stop:5565 length:297 start_codon:yes stop_codon:yes gene_type:complete
MELRDVLKILEIALSCRNRAKMLLIENHYLEEQVFDLLVLYTSNVIETINLLSDLLEDHSDNLNTVECLEIMTEIKQRIDDSATIEDFLSKYVSLTVH